MYPPEIIFSAFHITLALMNISRGIIGIPAGHDEQKVLKPLEDPEVHEYESSSYDIGTATGPPTRPSEVLSVNVNNPIVRSVEEFAQQVRDHLPNRNDPLQGQPDPNLERKNRSSIISSTSSTSKAVIGRRHATIADASSTQQITSPTYNLNRSFLHNISDIPQDFTSYFHEKIERIHKTEAEKRPVGPVVTIENVEDSTSDSSPSYIDVLRRKGKEKILQELCDSPEQRGLQKEKEEKGGTYGSVTLDPEGMQWNQFLLVTPTMANVDVLAEIGRLKTGIDIIGSKEWQGVILIACKSNEDKINLKEAIIYQSKKLWIESPQIFDHVVRIHEIPPEIKKLDLIHEIELKYNEIPGRVRIHWYIDGRNLQYATVGANPFLLKKIRASPILEVKGKQLQLNASVVLNRCPKCLLLEHPGELCLRKENWYQNRPCLDCSFYNALTLEMNINRKLRNAEDHFTDSKKCPTKKYLERKKEQDLDPFYKESTEELQGSSTGSQENRGVEEIDEGFESSHQEYNPASSSILQSYNSIITHSIEQGDSRSSSFEGQSSEESPSTNMSESPSLLTSLLKEESTRDTNVLQSPPFRIPSFKEILCSNEGKEVERPPYKSASLHRTGNRGYREQRNEKLTLGQASRSIHTSYQSEDQSPESPISYSKKERPGTSVLIIPISDSSNNVNVLAEIQKLDTSIGFVIKKVFERGVLVICESAKEANRLEEVIAESENLRVKPMETFFQKVRIPNMLKNIRKSEVIDVIYSKYHEEPHNLQFRFYFSDKSEQKLAAVFEVSTTLLSEIKRSPTIEIRGHQLEIDTSIQVDRCENCHLLGHKAGINCRHPRRSYPSRGEPCIDCAFHNEGYLRPTNQVLIKLDHPTNDNRCPRKIHFLKRWKRHLGLHPPDMGETIERGRYNMR